MLSNAVVAVVDDDLYVRRSLARLLHFAGYEVRTYPSGQELLDAGLAEGTACLVIDIHLGSMNGFDLNDQLRSAGARQPVIFITAHDDDATRERAHRVDSSTYLRKPFEANAILDAVGAAVSAASGPH